MSKGTAKLCAFILIMVAAFVGNHYFGWSDVLGSVEKLSVIRDIARERFFTACILYTLATIAGCVFLALPGITYAVLAGAVFGAFRGTVICLGATTVGAVAAFLAGRYFLQDSLKPMLEKSPALKRMLLSGNVKSEMTVLMITRMVPVFPYNLQNFAYGITTMHVLPYTLYTFIFMAPGVAFITLASAGILEPANRVPFLIAASLLAVAATLAGLFIRKKYLGEEEA